MWKILAYGVFLIASSHSAANTCLTLKNPDQKVYLHVLSYNKHNYTTLVNCVENSKITIENISEPVDSVRISKGSLLPPPMGGVGDFF